MDLITVDVTDLNEDPAALAFICDAQPVDSLAQSAGTIGYEMLTGLSPRYSRRYVG
jgi:alanine racemase